MALDRLIRISVVLGIAAFMVLAPARFRFWYDSWTYFELAQSFGNRFYHVSTLREFESGGGASSAFPPLWPSIIAALTRLHDSILVLYVASGTAFIALAAGTEQLGRRLFSQRGTGLLAVLLLLAFPGMRWDLAGGGSMALFLYLLALLGALFLRFNPQASLHAMALGALAGLLVMLRFDAMPAAVAALLAAPVLGVRGRRLALVALSFGLVIAPWVIYSWTHFHTLFATDNRVVALAIDPNAYVMDFHPTPQPTLGDDPVAWLTKLFVHLPIVMTSLGEAILRSVFLLPLIILAGVQYARQPAPRGHLVAPLLAHGHARGALLLIAVVLAPLTAYLVTGYQESRYFAPFIWLSILLTLGIALALSSETARRAIIVVACVAGAGKSIALVRYLPSGSPLGAMQAQLTRGDVDHAVGCLRQAGADRSAGVLFLTNIGTLNAYRFGALTGWRAASTPRNWLTLSNGERETFVQRFNLTFVVDTLPLGPARLPTVPLAGCDRPLHRIAIGPTGQ